MRPLVAVDRIYRVFEKDGRTIEALGEVSFELRRGKGVAGDAMSLAIAMAARP